ncbi:hypothetical protein Tco_0577983 [Tanacetum coccineum]
MAYSSSSSNANSKKVEAQLVVHQQNQLWYEQKIKFMKIDLDDKTDVLTYHKKLLAEALEEKEDLKTKFEFGKGSIKNPWKLAKILKMRANQTKPSESDTRSSDFDSCESNTSVETLDCMPEPVVNEPKVVSTPKVWSDAPIIKEYESDSEDDEIVVKPKEEKQIKVSQKVWEEEALYTAKGKNYTASCMFIPPMTVNTASLIFEEQTATGKEISNPLMADSLPKTIWLSIHHVLLQRIGYSGANDNG